MFLKKASILLLAQCFQAISANSLQGNENIPCTHDKCGQTLGASVLQIGAAQHRTKNVFNTLEHWQDITQYNLFSASDLVKGIPVSKEKWAQAFDKLDKNADGEIDGYDLAETAAEFASRHLNVSQDDYRLAVATMAKQFPEYADFMIEHEPVLVFLSETNESVPDDAPVPDDESIAMFQKRRRNELALLESANDCHQAFGKFAYYVTIYQLQLANIYLLPYLGDQPPSAWVQKLIKPFNDWSEKDLMETILKDYKNKNAWGIGEKMWDLLKDLVKLGLTKDLIEEATDNMGWWDFAKFGVTMTATLTAQMATGGAAIIAKLVSQIIKFFDRRAGASLSDLFQALERTVNECM